MTYICFTRWCCVLLFGCGVLKNYWVNAFYFEKILYLCITILIIDRSYGVR